MKFWKRKKYQQSNMDTTFYNPQQVSEIFKVSIYTVLRLIKDKKLTAAKIGSQWRIDQDSLDQYIKARTIKSKKQPA